VREKLVLTSAGFASMFGRPLNVLFSLGPFFSFNLEVAKLYSMVFIMSPRAKEHSVVEPDGTQKTLRGMVFQLFFFSQH